MKKRYTIFFFLLLQSVAVLPILAQSTAPSPIELIYSFTKGDTLRYEHEIVMSQYGSTDGAGFQATVVVEDVDTNGNIAMHITKKGITTLSSYSNSADGSTQKMIDDESMRVIMDKHGNYIKCSDVVAPEYISNLREEMRISGKKGHVRDDSSNVISLLKQLFPKLPAKNIRNGSHVIDTTVKERELIKYNLADTSKSPAIPRPPVTVDKEVTIDSLFYIGDEKQNGEDYRRFIKYTSYSPTTIIAGSNIYVISTILVRKRDGVIVSMTNTNDSSKPNGKRKNLFFEETLKLK